MGKIELVENIEQKEAKLIGFPNIDGPNVKKLKDYLNEEEGEVVTNSVFKNALQSVHYFSNPKYNEEYTNLSKLIAIGRVQSGKTSFFIASIALAFDNGYDICYLI